MSTAADNKAIVGHWFTAFWGKTCDLTSVDELAAPDMLLQYSLHAPRRGRDDIKAFMTAFRTAFPDLNFWGAADLIAEGDYVVGRWEGGGTHTGPAFRGYPEIELGKTGEFLESSRISPERRRAQQCSKKTRRASILHLL
jgi:hypothetical protein